MVVFSQKSDENWQWFAKITVEDHNGNFWARHRVLPHMILWQKSMSAPGIIPEPFPLLPPSQHIDLGRSWWDFYIFFRYFVIICAYSYKIHLQNSERLRSAIVRLCQFWWILAGFILQVWVFAWFFWSFF